MNIEFSTKREEEHRSTFLASDAMEEDIGEQPVKGAGERPTCQTMGSIPWERRGSS